MLVLLWHKEDAIASMFLFHWVGCVVVPALYMGCFTRRTDSDERANVVLKFIRQQFSGLAVSKQQALVSATIFLTIAVGSVATAAVVSQACWLYDPLLVGIGDRANEVGVPTDIAAFVGMLLYFTFVNSLLEELFWRGFLTERCGDSTASVWLTSAAYAAYHFVVLATVLPTDKSVNVWLGLLMTAGLVVAGVLFNFVYKAHGV
jgi:membrane protease YdiL (CAAX protease family)